MKYNRYLIVGITLLTVLFLFMFSGAVSETETNLFSANGFNVEEDGYGVLLIGMVVPLVFALIYVASRMKKEIHQ
ncbi:hypothetical protein [Methanolobus bombayensis]|uniref:hypothetical protein n=1 Tax=Methanolobus bombayensis TaxID=38023 RepID=UPI001AE6E825|nr:hypothetical protein [Methanolobus bombayensis]MBP1909910.1 hypothetical protein [Methanolobus bombayensis]